MPVSELSVTWKNYSSELATAYKSLLDDNFLVDCTISAEDRSLKAHRLVLSACSPYFHKLFHEESGKHPFVILLNTSFETLKAVIDFVYRGETQIPEGNLKAFLNLAQSLKITGLNTYTRDHVNKDVCKNSSKNIYIPPENNQDTLEIQDVSACQADSLENTSRLLSPQSDQRSNTEHTNSSVPIEVYSTSCEEVQSASMVLPPQELQITAEYNEVSEDTEITVKQEPLFPEFSEANKSLDDNKSGEPMTDSFTSEMDCGTSSVTGEEDLNLYPSDSAFSRGNEDSSVILPPQQELIQLSNEVASCKNVAERHQPSLLETLLTKSEQLDDESMDEFPGCQEMIHDTPRYDTNETGEERRSSSGEQNLSQFLRVEVLPSEEDLATQRRSLPGQQSESSPPHTELEFQEGPHAHPGEQTVLSDEGETQPSTSTSMDNAPVEQILAMLRQNFPWQQSISPPRHTPLQQHQGRHAHPGEQPVLSDEGEMALAHSPGTSTQMRGTSRKGPYYCLSCGKFFGLSAALAKHKRAHRQDTSANTNEFLIAENCPFRCFSCGTPFSSLDFLNKHKQRQVCKNYQTYPCDLCEEAFMSKERLAFHISTHERKRPYLCDVCRKMFRRKIDLLQHKREKHPTPRRFRCKVCNRLFAKFATLTKHKRKHSLESEADSATCARKPS